MDTYFARPEKASKEELSAEIEIVSNSPVVSGLLHSVSGLIAVLDENRQIVAINDSFLKMLGISDPAAVLGLRHGEVLKCIHAQELPAGCGTTKYCSSCGAAIAFVSSLEHDKPVEKICALSVNRDDKPADIALLVKSHPVNIGRKRFLMIFLQDITLQEQRAALERTFFHDVNNMLSMLLGASESLVESEPSVMAKTIHQAALRLHKEIAIQNCLSKSQTSTYQSVRQDITAAEVVSELKAFFAKHPVARDKNIEFRDDCADIVFNSDASLLSRVLCNMITNALEATPVGGTVRFWTEQKDNKLIFCVWNAQEIPPEAALRVFQRNFSTKEQAGRGIGTFSMKLLGEGILGGQVSFVTSRTDGTVFRFSHPV